MNRNGLSAQSEFQKVSGTVIDEISGDPLPFAAIGVKGSSRGTSSNQNGKFIINIRKEDEVLIVSFLGYESKEVVLNGRTSLTIELEPYSVELDEIVITPKDPTEYIRVAVRKFGVNYADQTYNGQSFYRNIIQENDHFLDFTEGIFKTYFTGRSDTSENQYQLELFRQVEELSELEFMSKNIKVSKKNSEPESDTTSAQNEIISGFNGPENIIDMDLTVELEEYLDSTRFKKFRYELLDPSYFEGRAVLAISFESKGKVDNVKENGIIYIDLSSDAIVAVETEGKAIIPFYVEPILFAFGFGITNPVFTTKRQYQYVEGKWYPKHFERYVDLTLTKKRMFKKNSKSRFQISQALVFTNILFQEAREIEVSKRFDADEDFSKQVFNDNNIKWDDVDVVAR